MGIAATKPAYSGEWSEMARDVVKGHLDCVFEAFRHHHAAKGSGLQGEIFGIDGSIGGGKTTLGHELAEELGEDVSFEEEYVDKVWLALFYGDPRQHAATFQVNQLGVCVAASKVMVERCLHGAIGIVDRTPLGNFCFAVLHLLRGNIPPDVFLGYLSTLTRSGPFLYTAIVFLLVRPEVAKRRVDLRTEKLKGRDPERKGVDLQYLRELDCVMLFVALYARARGVLRVDFLNWDKFGPARCVADRVLKPAVGAPPHIDEILLQRVLTADYQQLTAIASELCISLSDEQ